MDIEKLILEELRDIKETQVYQGRQLSNIDTRLSVIEHECRTLSGRVNNLNGCTKELAAEVDEISISEVCREKTSRGRKELIKIAGIILGGIGVVASITISIITIVCH